MTYRAMVLDGGFGLDRLGMTERAVPEPGHGEVRLRVGAVSLNRRDLLLVQGIYNPKQKLPVVPCSDGAGIIEAVGPGVRRFKPGDRAVLHFFTGWIAGEPDTVKLSTALGGPGGDGTLREMMILHEDALVPLPAAISTEAAATLPCAALTAWSSLADLHHTRPGDVVLVQGTGGVSLFALQFAKMLGARVIATTSSTEKAERLKAMGAEAVINYRETPDWGAKARELANGRIDLVIDVAGGDSLDMSLRNVRPGGTVAMVGVLAGAKANITVTLACMRQVRLQGVTCGTRESFEAMLRAIAQHGIDPAISHRFALEEAHEAFACMQANRHFGKIVVTV